MLQAEGPAAQGTTALLDVPVLQSPVEGSARHARHFASSDLPQASAECGASVSVENPRPASVAKVADRIRKLLNLATSSNVNEAAVAAEQAQKLMQEHKLSMLDVASEGGPGITELPIGSDGFMASWKFALVTVVARSFFLRSRGPSAGQAPEGSNHRKKGRRRSGAWGLQLRHQGDRKTGRQRRRVACREETHRRRPRRHSSIQGDLPARRTRPQI